MAKRTHYTGAHSQTGSSVGFVGWGNKKSSRNKVGLAQMAPAIDESTRFELVKGDQVKPSARGKKKKNGTPDLS